LGEILQKRGEKDPCTKIVNYLVKAKRREEVERLSIEEKKGDSGNRRTKVLSTKGEKKKHSR